MVAEDRKDHRLFRRRPCLAEAAHLVVVALDLVGAEVHQRR